MDFLVLSCIFCNPLHLFLMRKEMLLLFIFHLQGKKGFPLHTVSQGVCIASEQVIYQNEVSLSSLSGPKLEQGKNHNFVLSLHLLTLGHPQILHIQPKSGYLHSVVSRAGQPPCFICPKHKTKQDSGPKHGKDSGSSPFKLLWGSEQAQEPSTGLFQSDVGRRTP